MVIIMDMESGERQVERVAANYTDEVLLAEWTVVPRYELPQLAVAVEQPVTAPAAIDSDFLARAYRAQR